MVANLNKINKYYNGNHILKDIDLTINDNDRIGIIGKNGCGKTTLLKIITGMELPDRDNSEVGNVSVSKNTSIGFLQQNTGLQVDNTVIEEMKSIFSKLYKVQEKIRELEEKISETNHTTKEYDDISKEYTRLTDYFEANEGYMIEVKIKTVLNGMGFMEEKYNNVISTLSGGEKTRLAITKLLLENPNLLILDEPTNHLDFKTVAWLEDYLQSYKGALILVSHDRYFLDKLATSIAEIENGKLTKYKGNYTAFVKLKEMAVIRQLKEYEQQQEEIAKLQDYVDRNLVRASTTKSAQSRIKKLDNMELIEKPVLTNKEANLIFEYDIEPPKEVLTVNNLDLVVGEDNQLSKNINFEVRRGDKIALVGPNGIGKSSLLKVIQKQLPFYKGRINWAENVKISYFDQENQQLDVNNIVIDEINNRYRFMTQQEVRNILGKVRLVGENVFKKVGVISGGERAKLCFAIMMLERGNVLILDEPTNHLDLATKEILEDALSNYTGTIIFVSHDRYLLNKVADKIYEISTNGIKPYNCGFKEYIDIKHQEELAQEAAKADAIKKASVEKNVKLYRTKEQRSLDAKRKSRIREIEVSINNNEEKIKTLEKEMTVPEIYGDYQKINIYCKEIEKLKNENNDMTDEWMLLMDEE